MRPNTAAAFRRRRRRDLLDRPVHRDRQRRPHLDDPRGTVRLAAVRHRREERRVGLDQHAVERRERGGGAHVVGVLEQTIPLNERYAPRSSARARFVGTAGEAVEHRARRRDRRRRAPRNVSSHASREWITSARSSSCASCDLGAERDLLLVAGRVLVEEVEPALADAGHHVGVVPGQGHRARPTARPGGRHREGGGRRWPARRGGAGATVHRPAGASRGRCPRRPGPSTPAAWASATAASGSSSVPRAAGRWQWLSTQAGRRSLACRSRSGGRGARPSRAVRPPADHPTPRRRGAAAPPACRRGRGDATARRTARGISGDASSATTRSASRQSPSTAATAAASPALLSAHGCWSSM